LTLANALDVERSEISFRSVEVGTHKAGTIAGIGLLALRKDQLKDQSMFRLQNWLPPLLVSGDVKEILCDLKVTGIGFREIPLS
jgi:hypothetical protein